VVTAYSLRFGYSSSPSYGEAVRIASSVSGYVVEEVGRRARHTIPVVPESLAEVGRLLSIVHGWRNLELLADEVSLGRARLWALLRVLSCYQARAVSGLAELHCRGLPGNGGRGVPCRLVASSLPWAVSAEYRDPVLLPRLLLAHARQAMVEVCPVYDHDLVSRAAKGALGRAQLQQGNGGLRLRLGGELGQAAEDDERERIERLLRDVDFGTGA
jgi:hypothetical protein